MKVLQINAVNKIRSTGRNAYEVAEYLNENGHEGFIAYSDGPNYHKGFKIGSKLDQKLHGLFSRIFGLQGYFSRRSTIKLISYIDSLNPDIIHLNNLHANFINLELLLTHIAKNDIATVLTLHDCWFYTGKCTHYTIDNCYKWQNQCGNCPRLKKDNKSWFFDRTNKMQKDKKKWFGKIPRLAVVGVSDWITSEARKSLLSSAKIITRIYNWINLDVFKPVNTDKLRKKLNLEDKFVILGVASGWSNAKGLDKFIELASFIDEDDIILLVGIISKNIELPSNIINIEKTDDVYELAKYYSLADVFLNMSLEETFGKVTAEALACGTPVITNTSTANTELVGKGCGYILKNYHSDNIMDIINCIKANGKQHYSLNCMEYVKNSFNISDRIQDYIILYEMLIEGDVNK